LIKAEVYTSDECIQRSYSEDYEGKILVLPTQSFHPVSEKLNISYSELLAGLVAALRQWVPQCSVTSFMMVRSADTAEGISLEYLSQSWSQS
jgi:hypothetical protein